MNFLLSNVLKRQFPSQKRFVHNYLQYRFLKPALAFSIFLSALVVRSNILHPRLYLLLYVLTLL